MSSRKFIDIYERPAFGIEYNKVKELLRALQTQIKFILKNEDDNKWLAEKLEELSNLEIIFKEYLDEEGKYCIENLSDELMDYMIKKHPDGSFPKNDVIEFYNQSEVYSEFKKYVNQLFNIEDEVHKKITIELWKGYCTPVDKNFKQGDIFRYIVHSGYNIIKLPGLPDYKKNRNIDGDFVSASLISNEQMHMYNGNVGLILEPNESIIASSIGDSGTRIDKEQGMNSILDFGNGTFVNTRLDDHIEYIPTKIQSPKNLHNKFMKELERRNEAPLAEGWPVNEVVLDDRKIKVIGVFFRVNENQLLLHDYVRAHNMSVMYKVPLRVVNVDIYKEQEDNEEKKYEKLRSILKEEIKDNYDLILLYWYNVVISGEFCADVCKIFREEIKEYQNDIRKKDDGLEH